MDISWRTPKIDFDTVDGRRNPAPLGWLKPTPKWDLCHQSTGAGFCNHPQ